MITLPEVLALVLDQVRNPRTYYALGTLDMHPLRLEVDGIGQIALPLLPVQAEQLIGVSEQAGRDHEDRQAPGSAADRPWQIDAAQVRILGRRWEEDLAEAVTRAAAGLGVAGGVEAELYKLLVYDEGAFRIPEHTGARNPGIFATLLVMLPSPYPDGELVIRHKGREERLDLSHDEPSEIAYAAFFGDCCHEVPELASGYRLALVYDLIRPQGEPLPRPPDRYSAHIMATWLMRDWKDTPRKLVYPLEHLYTDAPPGFQSLKGTDAKVAGALQAAARAADCDLHLARVTVFESGIARQVETDGGESDGGESDAQGGDQNPEPQDEEAHFEIAEVCDFGRIVHHWQLPDGSSPGFGNLFLETDEISPPDAFAAFQASEPELGEPTDDEGVYYDRLHQCTALVIWPRTHRAAAIADGGLTVSMPYLSRLMDRWQEAGAVADDATWREAHALALAIRDAWPGEDWQGRQASHDGLAAALLDALSRLGDRDAALEFVSGRVTAGAYDQADNDILLELLCGLPAARSADLLAALVAGNAARKPAACAALLARAAADPHQDPRLLRPAAWALFDSVLDPSDQSLKLRWQREAPSPALVTDTLTALATVDSDLANQALTRILFDSDRYPMDDILVPAALSLAGRDRQPAAAAGLREAVLAHLERRIAEALEPPSDWQRPATIRCRCPDCRGLSEFLESPSESVWRLEADQSTRDHVGHSIERDGCDLECTTDKRGHPYALVCTKNRTSYQQRIRQREKDLADRERLARI